jgi:hypothetical protein
MTIQEIDLPEATRRNDVYRDINEIIDKLNVLPVFPSLAWVYAWDIIRDKFENSQWDDVHKDGFEDYAIPKGLELKTIWDTLWEEVDSLGLSLEYGSEVMVETINDWLIEKDFLVMLDNDGWLDD